MKEILDFIFRDIWHFMGTCLLLMIISDIFSVRIMMNPKKNDSEDKNKKK